jgi:uncharacterized protein
MTRRPDDEVNDPVLDLVVQRLLDAYEPDRVYLFGSKARGDGDADSDYDLLLVVPEGAPPHRVSSRLAYKCLRGTGVAVDVVVWRRGAFERRQRVPASLPATVLLEGRLLHGA